MFIDIDDCGAESLDIDNLALEDIKRGYSKDVDGAAFRCSVCGETFESGEIYEIGGRLFEAERAAVRHIEAAHGDYTGILIEDDTKYNNLTENQKTLLRLFASGMPDKEIAKETGVSASTVRHQRFMFRERAKQAKLYLAVYERVFAGKNAGGDEMAQIHNQASMVDERYVVTEREKERILSAFFFSLEPLRLKLLSPKEKKKIVILTKIAEQFTVGKDYTEKVVNAVLSEIYDDFATLRRYLIEYGFMKRTNDGSRYWRT